MTSQESDQWGNFQNLFMDLAREEQGRADVITNGSALRRVDKLLRAACTYNEHPEGWERGKPEQGLICLLETPKHGVWNYTNDGISENFFERVRLCVATAGRALPDYPHGADPEDFWLHRLYLSLLKCNSDSLFCATEEGGTILSVTVASATFCARLGREALVSAEPITLTESVRAGINQANNHNQTPAIEIDRAIVSWKRLLGIDDGSVRHDLHEWIPRTHIDLIERQVWANFFDEARLPRPVEVEWESVLSNKTPPHEEMDLALTITLTREYAKAIGRALSKVADLYTTAAISRLLDMTNALHEAFWRECLEFASGLAQWDVFGTWVDKVTRIKWTEPLTPEGRIDQGKLDATLARRRKCFQQRIGMYSTEWLNAADGAIHLRLTASVSTSSYAQNNGKTAQAVGRKTNTLHKRDPEVAKRTALVGSNPGTSAQDMCEIFDRESVPLPRKWQEAGLKTWRQAYRDASYHSKIDTLISKDRAKD
jgi:hypothetical protein